MARLGTHWTPRLACLALVTLVAAGNASAQTPRDPRLPQAQPSPPPAPVRDRVVTTDRTGAFAITGRVVDGVTGAPIARAKVRIPGGPSGPRGPVLTDGTGAFVLPGVPAGNYTLLVEKSTYMNGQYPAQARSMRTRERPLVVGGNPPAPSVTVRMYRGGVIAGRVLDAYGDPVERAQIQAIQLTRSRPPSVRGTGVTNDLGEFRLARLESGRYVVRAVPMAQQYGPPGPQQQPPPVLPQPLPAYYPDAPAIGQARPLDVSRGETLQGIDLILSDGIPGIVSGVVLLSDGQPVANGFLRARPVAKEIAGFDGTGGTGVQPNGAFRFQLPPGEYYLEATVSPQNAQNLQNRPNGETQQFGFVRLTVGSGPIDGVSIVAGKGATGSGRVVFEGTTPPPASPGRTRIPMFNPDGDDCRQAFATIAPDWTFTIEGLGGLCMAAPQTLFGRWTVKAVMVRGENVLERTMAFESGQQYTNVQVIVSDQRTQLDLRVTAENAEPTKEYVALVYSTDKEKWGALSRYMRAFVPETANGPPVFVPGMERAPRPEQIVGLPDGAYYAIAVDDLELEDSRDPAVLERLALHATRVELVAGAPIEVPLRRVIAADVLR